MKFRTDYGPTPTPVSEMLDQIKDGWKPSMPTVKWTTINNQTAWTLTIARAIYTGSAIAMVLVIIVLFAVWHG